MTLRFDNLRAGCAMQLDLGDSRAIIAEAEGRGASRTQLAYILATAKWETAHTMKPVRETLAESDDEAIHRLERAWADGRLAWVRAPYWRRDGDGRCWLGRGYVQLTHKANYERAAREIGVDLVGDPGLALDGDVARVILVRGMLEAWFTRYRLSDFVTQGVSDFENARRIVNGRDHAAQIAAIARAYDEALWSAGFDDGSAKAGGRPIRSYGSGPTHPGYAGFSDR